MVSPSTHMHHNDYTIEADHARAKALAMSKKRSRHQVRLATHLVSLRRTMPTIFFSTKPNTDCKELIRQQVDVSIKSQSLQSRVPLKKSVSTPPREIRTMH